ncbi:unnamed protein product [Rotaria socialis]|uniref:Reverse transcriptase RNase H-like domain-containing protein n=1 Tax=Rotaria socialis TaxID=392032 RepID=A0A820R3G2_9BILA|nr:unnamed protein product [Rotaria socialis]CAF4429687.1 unnamed protein product [Rotaria socialis]
MTYLSNGEYFPSFMSLGDFNNATRLDIAVIYQYPKSVGILLEHGKGTSNSIVTLLTGADSNPDYLSISDFNNDDRLDIAITNIGENNFDIFLEYANGTFTAQIILRTNEDASLSAIVTSDFNNDGFKDIGVTILNNSVSRTLCSTERNYTAVEHEALAIVWATKHFRQYPEGGSVIVRSDFKARE